MWKCKKEAKRKMSDDFDAIGHRHHHGKHSWSHHRSSHSHDQKNYTRGDTNSTSSGRGKWSFSKRRNYTASGGNGTSSMGGGGWWNRNRNTSDNSKMDKLGEARAQVYCRFKYVMVQCLKDAVEPCHGNTAQIMYEFMRNMSDPDCQDKMVEWEDAKILQLVDDCKGATCSGCRLPLPWLGLLMSMWIMMMKRFY